MAEHTVCPRCAYETVETLFTSPVLGVWDVLQCQRCLYMWRTSEPARRTQRDAYPEQFKMTVEDIVNAPEVPVIPPTRVVVASECAMLDSEYGPVRDG